MRGAQAGGDAGGGARARGEREEEGEGGPDRGSLWIFLGEPGSRKTKGKTGFVWGQNDVV